MRLDTKAIAAALALPASFMFPVAMAATPGPSLWAPPVTTRGTCVFKETEIAASASFDESTSTSWVNLKDAGSITFTQRRPGCVAGSLFANAGNDTDHVLLQVLLDGSPCAPLTAGYIFANAGSDISSHSAAFFCGAKVAPGKHTIQVQYASGLGGNSEFFQRTLEVLHE